MHVHSNPWRRRLLTAGVAAAAVAAPIAMSANAASAHQTAHAAKSYTIALIPGLTTDPFYITMHNGAEAEAKKLGVKLIWQGAPQFEPTLQIPVVNTVLAEHPSALLIAPTDVKALQAPIQKFVNDGIPVIAVDTTINDAKILKGAVTSDNLQGGEAAADAIAKLAHDKGDVAVDNVAPGISTTDLRTKGFIQEIKSKYPNMTVVGTEYNNDSATTAESQVKNLLLAHPNLVGIFATNLYGAQGAGAAINSLHDAGKVFVAAYDPEPATVKLLKQGAINVLVMQQPAVEGADGVLYAYDELTGKGSKVPKETLVPNVVATTANASSPSITKYYYQSSLS